METEKSSVASLTSALQLLEQSRLLFFKKIKVLLAIMVLPTIVELARAVLFMLLIDKPTIQNMALSLYRSFGFGGMLWTVIIPILLLSFISIIISSWSSIALVLAIQNDSLTAIDAYNQSFHKINSYWWVTFLVGGITAAGFFLFIIPGIIVSVWFAFAIFVLVLENKKGLAALFTSREYVRGRWWRIWGRMIFVNIFVGVIFWVILIAFGVVFTLLHIKDGSQFVSQILYAFATPFTIIYSYLLYKNLVGIKGTLVVPAYRGVKMFLITASIIGGLVFLLIFSLPLLYLFVVRPYQITGDSMMPRYTNGQYYITNLLAYTSAFPERGDVIILKSPQDTEKRLIKRVIGLPGEAVILRNGSVYINNQKLDEHTYLVTEGETIGNTFMHDEEEIIVPKGRVFVLGDNRSASLDSRSFGSVRVDYIVGKIAFCYWKCSGSK